MKQIQNKQSQLQPPILAGYSDKRVHLVMFAGLITIFFGGPQYFLINSVIVLAFGTVTALIAATYQACSERSNLLFRRTMDRIYYGGKNAEIIDCLLEIYKSPFQLAIIRSVKYARRLKKRALAQYHNSKSAQKVVARARAISSAPVARPRSVKVALVSASS